MFQNLIFSVQSKSTSAIFLLLCNCLDNFAIRACSYSFENF